MIAEDVRDRFWAAVAALLSVLFGICMALFLLTASGCGATPIADGSLVVEGEHVRFRTAGDTKDGVCGELQALKFPAGIVACYDADGRKVRVCASWAGVEILCLPLGASE